MLGKPRKISITYIASSKQDDKKSKDDANDLLKKLQADSEDKECPFC